MKIYNDFCNIIILFKKNEYFEFDFMQITNYAVISITLIFPLKLITSL